jgi:hypothetical protein
MSRIADRTDLDPRLWKRVYAEYMEMPGLLLTVRQASRLWHLDLEVSQQVLDALVESAFLRRSGAYYVRADSGRAFL